MPKISAEFPDHPQKKAFSAFGDFLKCMKQLRGYRYQVDTSGSIIHHVDFYEADLNLISGVWGRVLESRWKGTYFLNNKPLLYVELWRQCLRSDQALDKICCPRCGTSMRNIPTGLTITFNHLTGEFGYVVSCKCGADVSELYNAARAISTSKTPLELVKKSRGEL